MFSWLKKHFIPHSGNDHRPHILHGHNMRYIIGILFLLEIATFLAPTLTRIHTTGGLEATVLSAVLAQLTNEERQTQNLKILKVNSILNEAAELKAMDMATKSYFSHTNPDGKNPWYWLEQVGYKYQYAGENLAINFSDSKDVTNAWMNSPTHKANIVKGNYTEIGTGVATGIYEGKETVFVAQIYANPLPKTASKTIEEISEISQVVSVEKSTNVLGAETINTPTFWQKAFASPRNTTNIILYVVFGIISFALLLYVFIRMKNHHKDLITNGLIVLTIVGAIFVANYYLSRRNMIITQSLDYSNENK